jgi:hypothetical protein
MAVPFARVQIPATLSLAVLNQGIEQVLQGVDRSLLGHNSNRFIRVCDSNGISCVWMLATMRHNVFAKMRGCGYVTVRIGLEALKSVGCQFDMFPELRRRIESAMNTGYWNSSGFRDAFFVLSKRHDPDMKEDERAAIVDSLGKWGLRPGMAIEEIFQQRPTMTEELLQFMQGRVHGDLECSEMLVWEIVRLACSSNVGDFRREKIVALAKEHLSADTLMELGLLPEAVS